MNENRLREILTNIRTVRVAVVGDFFLDRYWEIVPEWDEPSVETGLTAYQIDRVWGSPGAAGTVTNNLAALGVGKIYAVGFLGRDGEGFELAGHLDRVGVSRIYMTETPLRATPCYTKPMRNGVEMNRFDIKNRTKTPEGIEDVLITSIREVAGQVHAILVMDQVSEANCGVLTDRVRECLIQLGRENSQLLIYADSRERISLYREMIVKCNEREALESFGFHIDHVPALDKIEECAFNLAAKTGRPVFVTLGERGQLVVDLRDGQRWAQHVPTVRLEGDIDICGAGDAASAAIVASLSAGASLEEAAMIGNRASSVTIRKIGQTGTASPEEILEGHS